MTEILHRKPKSFLFGYRYQSLVGILRLIDLLNEKVEKVYFERKEDKQDKFDDIKVFSNDKIHHYQVKGSYAQNELHLKDFTTSTDLHISLPEIFQSWSNLSKKFPEKKNYFHIYTTKSISESEPLINFLKKIDDDRVEFCENKDKVYCLSDEILTNDEFEESRKIIEELNSDSELKDCLSQIIIETEQPGNPPSEIHSEVIVGPVEEMIKSKIEALGLHSPPQNMNIDSIFTSLFNLVNRESVTSEKITKEILERYLKIKQDFDSIKNTIDFDESRYVVTKNNLELLDKKIKEHSGSILAIYGKPGSGKTWLLTKWRKVFEEKFPETPPIWHYASISVTEDEDMEIRITKQKLLNNFMKLISDGYELNTKDRYGVTPEKLQVLLNKIGEIAESKSIVIPIIVDGLDHVDRIKKRAHSLARDDETIFDFLNEVSIPQGICFVFGTQMGSHLDELKTKYGDEAFFEISGFVKEEVKEYFDKSTVPEEFSESEKLNKIIEITDGLPLLVNYFVKLLLQYQDFEIVQKIPLTQGDVKKYYDYLWGEELTSKDFTKILAKYLALLEFSTSNEFLEILYPEDQRDYHPLNDSIKPLLPLLRINESDEISIFHDSFREYLLQHTDFDETAKKGYSEKIYESLSSLGLLTNQKAYRHALKYGLKAKKLDEILKIVDVKFVDDSVIQIWNRRDIQNNIDISIRAAFEKHEPISIIEKALLKKYTVDRFQNLDEREFDKLILRLSPEKIASLLLYEKKLNLSLSETVWYLGNGLKNGLDLPYEEILKIWKQTHKSTPLGEQNKLPEEISLNDFAIILCYSENFKRVISFIDANDFQFNTIYSMIKDVLPFTTYDEIKSCNISGTKLESFWNLILFEIFNYYDKSEEFRIHFETHRDELLSSNIPEFRLFLKKSNIQKEEIHEYFVKTTIEDPTRGELDISIFLNLEKNVAIAGYTENSDNLKYYFDMINGKSDSFFKRTLLTVYHNTLLSMKKNEDISQNDIDVLYDSLISMMDYDQHRLFDEPGYNDHAFQNYISKIIEESIQLIISKSDVSKQKELLNNYGKFGLKQMFTSISRDNFMELITKYSDSSEVHEEIVRLGNAPITLDETSSMMDICIDAGSLFLSINDKTNAQNYFNKAVILSHSYGWRKDSFLFEVLEMFDDLGIHKQETVLKNFGIVLKYTEFLDVIADGSGERQIPTLTIEKMLKYNSKAGLRAIQEYGVDSYRFSSIVQEFCKIKIECTPVLRYYLLKTVLFESHYNNNNNLELFEIKHSIITSLLNQEPDLAKELVEDLRKELLQDFSETTKIMETKFNQLTTILELSKIELKNCKPDKESSESEAITIGETPEELYTEFEKKYGWSLMWNHGRYTHLLEKSYGIDSDKTNLLISGGISEKCITHNWEVIGMVEAYSRFLSKTEQISKLQEFSDKISIFLDSLFRERIIDFKHNFSWLETFSENDDPNKTGFLFLLEQLNCSDTEVSKKAYVALVRCLEFKVPSILKNCVETLLHNSTQYIIKEKLSAIFDSYVTSTHDSSELIKKSIEYLEKSDYANFQFTSQHMTGQLEL